jgi:polyisoprenoid-binding protein YceI
MKFLILLALSLSASAQTAPLSLTADIAASQLRWTGHAAVGSYAPTGTIKLKRGVFTLAPDGRTPRTATVVVAMPTLAGENDDLVAHLRNADFFDVDRYPTATFELTAFRADSASGRLTIKGITKPVRLPATLVRTPTGWRLRGTAHLDRTAFGVVYNSPSFFALADLGDQAIGNIFDLAFDVVLRPAPANQATNRSTNH